MSATTFPNNDRVDANLHTPQICRAFACLLVAVYHGAALLGLEYGVKPLLALTDFGFAGVHMFFVISGLIIYHAHRADVDNFRRVPNYLLKRLIRIYPLYWIVLFLDGGWKVLTHRVPVNEFFLNALFFTSHKSLIIAVAWTLAYEMVFYGIFVTFVVKRTLGIVVFVTWFVLVALNHRYQFANIIVLQSINGLFMLGLLTAIAMHALRDRLSQKLRDWVGIASLFAGATIFVGTGWWYISLQDAQVSVWENVPLAVGFGSGSALLLLATLSAKLEGLLKRRRLLLLIGDASYSIYLVHFFFQTYATRGLRALNWGYAGEKTQWQATLLLAVIMVVSAGCGILVHRYVEKPVLAKCRRWLAIGAAARATARSC